MGQDQRRFPRLNLTDEQFKLKETGKVYGVADLSTSGIGLRILDAEDLIHFPVARKIEGTLKIQKEKLRIQAEVKNVRRDMVGCELVNLSADAKKMIDEFLDPKRLGSDLKPVTVDEPFSEWFHAATGTDVLIERTREKELKKFTIFLLGSYIQWERYEGLRTGRIAAAADIESVSSGLIRLETMILDADLTLDQGKLGLAKTLVLSSNLAKDIQTWLLSKLAG